MTETKVVKAKPIENFALTVFSITTLFYTTLLAKLVWGWFLADKLFEVTYWELFLGILVARFMIGTLSSAEMSMRLDYKFDADKFGVRLSRKIGVLIGHTLMFGVFFLVNLIISYYS